MIFSDSIIFVQRPDCYVPEIGSFLGEMTDEIVEEYGIGSKMTEFYSTGPKTYAFKVETPNADRFKFKARGIKQNIASIEAINFDVIRDKSINKASYQQTQDSVVPQLQFRTDKYHLVTTRHLNKHFNVTSDKRIVLGNDTVPFGFIDESVDDFVDFHLKFKLINVLKLQFEKKFNLLEIKYSKLNQNSKLIY